MRRIRFKGDAKNWVRTGDKLTTYRTNPHDGPYEIDNGSRYNPSPSGLVVHLTPLAEMSDCTMINEHYATEGPFASAGEFITWLKKNHLKLPRRGWLNRIDIISQREPEATDKVRE